MLATIFHGFSSLCLCLVASYSFGDVSPSARAVRCMPMGCQRHTTTLKNKTLAFAGKIKVATFSLLVWIEQKNSFQQLVSKQQLQKVQFTANRHAATYRKLRKVSSRVPKKNGKRERNNGKKRSKRRKGLPSSWKKMILLKVQRVIAEVRMQWCTHVALPESPTVMFTTRKRPRPTMRYPPHIKVWTMLGQASFKICVFCRSTLLLSNSRSPNIFLFLSVFLADKGVFQVMSINKSMSSNKKLLSLANW